MTGLQDKGDLDKIVVDLVAELDNTHTIPFSQAMGISLGTKDRKVIDEQKQVDASEFYKQMLPELREDCSYCVSTLSESGIWTDHEVSDMSYLLILIDKHTASGDNVFVAMNTFDRNNDLGKFSRKAKYADQGKCLWADIDCDHGSTTGQYRTKEEALAAIEAVTSGGAIPKPTYVVDSGHGFHLYWVLNRSMVAPELKILASDFEKMLITAGLKTDDKVTTDMARVLRAVGSYNMKGE